MHQCPVAYAFLLAVSVSLLCLGVTHVLRPGLLPTGRGWGVMGYRPANPPPPKNLNIKTICFVGIRISKVLRDLLFGRNQPLKSADDWYLRILKNKLIKLNKKDRTL
jgi:hypothetical protein